MAEDTNGSERNNVIQVRTKEHPEPKSFVWELPSDLDGLVAKFGAESVYENARANLVIGVQAFARRHIEKSEEEIQKLVDDYDPNTRSAVSRLTPAERALKALSGMSAEERAEVLARFA